MTTQASTSTVMNIFKKVYGDCHDLLPEGYPFLEMCPFSQSQKVGESYSEALVLTAENGLTLGGTAGEVVDINPARAGAVKQATVTPYFSVLASVVPWAVLSRSAGAGEKAFKDATKHIVKNNLKSHMNYLEILAQYGQSSKLLGYVSYATATYRTVALTNGAGTVGGVAFTAGVSASAKAIMLAPGNFAAGIWVGKEGAVVNQVDSNGVVVASGSLVSVDSENGILYVDFTPVAATSTTSHRVCFDGMESAKEMVGSHKIISNTGTLFGISAATSGGYSLYRGTQKAVTGLLTFANMQQAAALAMNRAGLTGEVEWKINPRSFANLINVEAARRSYDDSYGKQKYENGAEEIEFFYAGGRMTIKGSPFVMEGDAFGYVKDSWVRSGSSDISLSIPGIEKPIIFPLENSTAHAFRSYSDQYVLCREVAKNMLITGINDEAAS